ncbi:hypothetical protein LPJ71_012071, partial [Coemansia sp. S17]
LHAPAGQGACLLPLAPHVTPRSQAAELAYRPIGYAQNCRLWSGPCIRRATAYLHARGCDFVVSLARDSNGLSPLLHWHGHVV